MQDNAYVLSVEPQDRRYRARDTVLTLLMWGVYVYLWVPLITLGGWLLGYERFYTIMILYGGLDVVLELMDWYALIISMIAVCIISWAGINYSRFHDRERRYAAPATKAREISEFFGISSTEVDRVRSSKRLLIDLDEFGGIAKITHYGVSETDDESDCLDLGEESDEK